MQNNILKQASVCEYDSKLQFPKKLNLYVELNKHYGIDIKIICDYLYITIMFLQMEHHFEIPLYL